MPELFPILFLRACEYVTASALYLAQVSFCVEGGTLRYKLFNVLGAICKDAA